MNSQFESSKTFALILHFTNFHACYNADLVIYANKAGKAASLSLQLICELSLQSISGNLMSARGIAA